MPLAQTATGATLHYEDIGSGEPVIVIHGLLGTARNDCGAIMDWLSETHRVIGLTLRGYGESTPKPRDFPTRFYERDAKDVIAFMDAIGLEKAHILGYSDGGEVTLTAAGIAPERFLSAASWGSVGYFGPDLLPIVQRMYPADWVTEEDKALHGIDDPNPMILQWIQAAKMMIADDGDVSMSTAGNITCPVLLMLGENDRLNPESYGQNFVSRVKNGRVQMFADTGHPIHRERPEEFKQVYGEFLRSGR